MRTLCRACDAELVQHSNLQKKHHRPCPCGDGALHYLCGQPVHYNRSVSI